MLRRGFVLASLATAAASPARASERTIGWISPETRETTSPFFQAFIGGLRAIRGGEQVQVLERYIPGGPEAIVATVAELQQKGVALIVSQGAATPAVMRANPTVPVVFGFSGDPVVARFVQSLARPGANATGVSFMSVELNPKRIDFVRAALPHARKFGLLSNANHAGEENEIVACQQALQPVGVQLSVYRVSGMNEIQPAVARALEDGIEVLVVLPSSSMVRQAASIANQCLARKVPVVSGWASMARDGLLLTYGPNLTDAYRRVAWYAMRVLGGAKPGDLPVEQPTKFELVVNKRTAATLGLTLPLGLLAQAEEIIE